MSATAAAPAAGPARDTRAGRQQPGAFHHTPVAAVVNGTMGLLALAELLRLTHRWVAPWWALAVGAALAVGLVLQGALRTVEGRHRPLSGRSLTYRAAVSTTAGLWLWGQVADFATVPRLGWIGLGMVLAAAVVATPAVWLAKVVPWWADTALAVVVVGLLFGGGSLVSRGGGLRVFTATARLDGHILGPWLGHALISLVVLGLLFGLIGRVCVNHEHTLDAATEAAREARRLGGDAAEFLEMLRDELTTTPAARSKVRLVGEPTEFADGAGRAYEVDTADAGLDYTALTQPRAAAIATRMRLPHGCTLEALRGPRQGRWTVQVTQVHELDDRIDYPLDQVQPRSIYNQIPFGTAADRSQVGPVLREWRMGIFGAPSSGKTTVLIDQVAGLIQCTDALVHVIDLNNGGGAGFFNSPFYRGEVDVPAIATVCTTPPEALGLVTWLRDVALDRKATAAGRKEDADSTLLPLTPDLPAHILVLDEGKMVTKLSSDSDTLRKLRETLEEIGDIARDSGINVVASILRAAGSDTDILANMLLRVAMGAMTQHELAFALGNDYTVDESSLTGAGQGFFRNGPAARSRRFKAWYLAPSAQRQIGQMTAGWRPQPDEASLVLDSARWYLGYWRRNSHLLTGRKDVDGLDARLAGIDPEDPRLGPCGGTGRPAAAPATGPAAAEEPDVTAAGKGIIAPTGAFADALAKLDQGAIDDRFHKLTEGLNLSDPASWSQASGEGETARHPDGPQVLERLVWWHGPGGIAPMDTYRALIRGGPWGPAVPVTQTCFFNWLKPKAPAGERRPASWLAPRKPGKQSPYVHRTPREDLPQPG